MINENIKKYVAQQLMEQTKILDLYSSVQYRRYFYSRLEKHILSFLKKGSPRWITVSGLRGVGKTTVLAQIFHTYQSKFSNRVLYVSLDEVVNKLGGNLFAVLDAYEDLLGESFHSLSNNILLLLDEVHFDPKWQDALKTLYDKSRRIFIISTVSSAVAINKTRRSPLEKMYPLQFTEYVMLSQGIFPPEGLRDAVCSAFFESETADEVFNGLKKVEQEVQYYWRQIDSRILDTYIRYYSLPSVLPYDDPIDIYRVLNNTLDRIVRQDLPSMYSFSPAVLSKVQPLLYLIASSDVRSVAGFAKDLRDIDEKTLVGILRILEDAELLLRVYPFSLSAPKKVRKPSKYLFFAPSLRAALIHLVDPTAVSLSHRGKILEDSVGMHLYSCFLDRDMLFSFDDARGGADFVLGGSRKIVVEVGWGKNSPKQVFTTMEDAKADYGLLVTDTPLLSRQDTVVTIPFEYFFFL